MELLSEGQIGKINKGPYARILNQNSQQIHSYLKLNNLDDNL